MPKKLIDALSDVGVRGAKSALRDGEPVDRKLHDGRGLYLLVRANGARHWRLKFYLAGRERLLALGEYPDVTLARARQKAGEARNLIREGVDPIQNGREQKALRVNAAQQTFAVIAEEWLGKKAKKWTEGHLEQNLQSLRDYVLPKIGTRAVASLTAQDIMRVLEPLEAAGKLETLRRVRQRIGSVLTYAVQTGRRTDNPIRDTQGAFQAPTREHFASIGPKGLPAFLDALEAYAGHPNTLGIIRMILWTGSRTGEVRGATPDEFDLDAGVWRIPAERMKKRRVHVVPLPRQAVLLLRELLTLNADSRYMFPSPMHQSMASENIVLQAIKRMGYGGQLTGHGLRAAVSTGLEEMGYPVEIIKTQLSHAKDNLTDAAYLRGVHLERRAEMMQAWADKLDVMLVGAKVLPLKAASTA
ncbi:MAG: tyrosine-type recombinase/integrase [Pseudomonadota bacterium]|jgi:integrase|uniref:tyrosine-type recombinase/integrase n=1 Tax=Aquabacterium sp. TaxID=1872578 RepID=UPI003BB0D245